MNSAQPCKGQGYYQRNPPSQFAVKHKHKEREEQVEHKYQAQEPANADHRNMHIRDKVETQRKVSKQVKYLINARRHHQVQQAKTRKEWQYPHIPFLVKGIRSNLTHLHPVIISAAKRESAYHHKHQCKSRKPRD